MTMIFKNYLFLCVYTHDFKNLPERRFRIALKCNRAIFFRNHTKVSE